MRIKKVQRLRVFSRHPSHEMLRLANIKTDVLSCIRFGSETQGTLKYDVNINTVDSVKNSKDKLLMKECFKKGGVKTAHFIHPHTIEEAVAMLAEYPAVVVKYRWGSRGRFNYLINDEKSLRELLHNKVLTNYIIEVFHNYNKEYRLHVTEDGCFYTCRKMLKSDVDKKDRWYRNDSNSTWIVEENPLFEKPSSWDAIVKDCVKALKSVGLDVGAFDVKVQSEKNKDRKEVSYIVIESNSAPSFGDITLQKYIKIIPTIITNKLKNGITNN